MTLKDRKDENLSAETELRIAEIMRRMFLAVEDPTNPERFIRGKTQHKLCEEWGLSLDSVQRLTAMASHRIRESVMDPEFVGAKVGSALDLTLERALEDRDHRNVIEVAKVWAQISGAAAPQKLDANVNVNPAATDELRAAFERIARAGGDQKAGPGGGTGAGSGG